MSLASRVVARYLAANGVVAEPGTTYVYQVDRNNQVLYPGEKVLVTVGEKLVRGEVILGNKLVTTENGAQLPSLAVKAEDGNTYDATASSITKLPQTIPTPRTVNASEAPQVIEKTVMEPRTVWVCPHCASEMHEKALFFNGSNYFHSVASCRGKPIRLPPPKEDVAAILRQWGLGR